MEIKQVARTIRDLAVVAGLVATLGVAPGWAALRVVAATPELADIAKQVGGNRVSVSSIAKTDNDYHTTEARPSQVVLISQASVVIKIGMDLDMWMDALLNAAGNPAVLPGGKGYVDSSVGIPKLEVPTAQITGASGDIHAYGNPHFYYDPVDAKIVAKNILDGLKRVDVADSPVFQGNYNAFTKEIDRRMEGWTKDLAPYKGQPVVIYHDSAIYFLERFGLKQFGTLEPKPGIPPSASHISDLIQSMKAEGVKAVVVESIYPMKFTDLITRETGARAVVVPYSVGALGTHSYFDLVDAWVQGYKKALSGGGS